MLFDQCQNVIWDPQPYTWAMGGEASFFCEDVQFLAG